MGQLPAGLQDRLGRIAAPAPVTAQAHWNNPHRFMAWALADQFKALVQRVDQIDQRLAVLAAPPPNAPWAKSGPGAGAALEPRLRVVLGTQPENCASAPTLAIGSGVAPRRIQRGQPA